MQYSIGHRLHDTGTLFKLTMPGYKFSHKQASVTHEVQKNPQDRKCR